MHFSTVTLLSVAITASLATPVMETEYLERDHTMADLSQRTTDLEELTLLFTSDRGNGERMEYYGVNTSAVAINVTANTVNNIDGNRRNKRKQEKPTRTLERKGTSCSANPTPSCDTKKNQAQNELCQNLINDLNAQYTVPIPKDWRQTCYRGTDGSCCTGWNTEVRYLRHGDLAANVDAVTQFCSANGISGKIYGTRLAGTCCNQCINSGHGCS
ncbi:hypothetical protein F4680DRAFT_448738 [Xylaria scruposa]|nr:hypothetical protein F4680DRAFT_448738 [Xylaria scruposa]